jgi:hypothetical protein
MFHRSVSAISLRDVTAFKTVVFHIERRGNFKLNIVKYVVSDVY